jgi:hypothetical protein
LVASVSPKDKDALTSLDNNVDLLQDSNSDTTQGNKEQASSETIISKYLGKAEEAESGYYTDKMNTSTNSTDDSLNNRPLNVTQFNVSQDVPIPCHTDIMTLGNDNQTVSAPSIGVAVNNPRQKKWINLVLDYTGTEYGKRLSTDSFVSIIKQQVESWNENVCPQQYLESLELKLARHLCISYNLFRKGFASIDFPETFSMWNIVNPFSKETSLCAKMAWWRKNCN